ncbi:MAG: hypothetical protein UR39_C0004G0054 [Candidatus Woesebacteria bacterium GW2011_GWA1_33_30]|uniref:Uncharacterized protein n=1 Tax=Candidatus Woesebacteria bacterium GW2011_GWA2_33_28 TaxID=1618561 RepID=A0A0G0A843_9BACT|nr:MAG: hypothetical protein UR38_C0004G0019 [Candidatus Woesebacteria bacterium GW2011_GWA2_33_28]KKP48433.1 MAG: hypothetical protein UR39_C0004G0054 [Candidatus Woesebacteria bacterium GW2011_GWA1_33_30]KKP49540.1 MAG: hypothetical protein UR40_C0005G0054 [Microgenomates group bacterium GW2011_GWC1_33_32]KKP52505.1 MAG: hypothetical protein UR44_C0002G0054 [Candidatus Woesebacteria bacterium GW2011_GWB1_33_38]KKP58363.1 MAG: hypothetical protein UR48_C0005G0041 [Microgenomates group bacteriu
MFSLPSLFGKKLNCLRDCNGACCHDMTIKALGEAEMAIIMFIIS